MMIKWNDKIATGHEGIDEQHKKLIDIIEQISILSNENNYDFSQLLEIVHDLDNYIDEHFKYEESLMSKYNYVETKEHVSQHNGLRAKIEEINIFDTKNSEKFYKDLLLFLVDWLLKHIMQTDKKFGAFLIEIKAND